MGDFLKDESKAVQQLIGQYFTVETWRELADAMKRRYLQMSRNYVNIPDGWEDNPMPKPDFMLKNDNVLVPKQKKNDDSGTCAITRKNPKRKVSPKNYYEEEEPTNDRYVFCDNCEEDYIDYCSKCGMLVSLKDNPVPMGVEMRARKTVPKGILEIRHSIIHGLGVFALKTVQKGVRLGPYQGQATKVDSSKGYAWKLRDGHLIDASDETNSNYLRYANCARNVSEQNLIAFQYQGELYYRTLKDIQCGEELLVYYGNSFAKNLGINTKIYFEPMEEKITPTTFSCKFCHIGLSNQDYRDKHEFRCKFNPIRLNVCTEYFTCKYCGCDVTSKEFLETHEKYCKPRMERRKQRVQEDTNAGKVFKCHYCEYTSKRKEDLKNHILRVHEKENCEIYYCNECKYKSNYKSNLKVHLKIHEVKNRFGCITCNINFNRKQSLDNHYLSKHPEKFNNITNKIFRCEYCEYKTLNKHSLKEHKCMKKLENGIEEKENLHFCTRCNYSTKYKSNLNVHLRIHDDKNKPFKCENCEKCFNGKREFDNHILSKHKNNTLLMKSITSKIHTCQICFYKTVNITYFKRHLKTHLKVNY